MTLIEQTHQQLQAIMTAHTRVVLWLSGGKDSTTLAHLLRPWAAQVTVATNFVDGGWPGIEDHVRALATAWGFRDLVVTTPTLSFDAYRQRFGWPMHLVPTAMDGVLPDPFYEGGPRVASFWHCTVLRVIAPLLAATYALQPDALLTASRAQDAPLFQRLGPVIEAWQIDPSLWTRYNPLHAWSTEAIWAYIDTHGLTLPPHYAWKRYASFEAPDCQLCPYSPEYVQHMRQADPDVYARLMTAFGPTLAAWRTTVQGEMVRWEGVRDALSE